MPNSLQEYVYHIPSVKPKYLLRFALSAVPIFTNFTVLVTRPFPLTPWSLHHVRSIRCL